MLKRIFCGKTVYAVIEINLARKLEKVRKIRRI